MKIIKDVKRPQFTNDNGIICSKIEEAMNFDSKIDITKSILTTQH